MQKSPLYTTRSGYFYDRSFLDQASLGALWSGTTSSGTIAYFLDYGSSFVRPARNFNRQIGLPVRCITQTFFGSSDFGYLLVEQGITSSFGTAGEDTGWSASGYSNIQKSPLCTTRSGFIYGGSFDCQASCGILWSGTTYSGTSAYYLNYGNGYVFPANNDTRQYGFPVRCIARELK